METGYRNENCYGSGVRDAAAVITYEIEVLGNTDIPDWCAERYTLSEDLRQRLAGISGASSEEISDAVRTLLSEVSVITGMDIRYVLWLADKDVVEDLYDGADGNIDAYPCSDVILSDLGEDGVLYAYAENPSPIR